MRYAAYENGDLIIREQHLDAVPIGAKIATDDFVRAVNSTPAITGQQARALFDALP